MGPCRPPGGLCPPGRGVVLETAERCPATGLMAKGASGDPGATLTSQAGATAVLGSAVWSELGTLSRPLGTAAKPPQQPEIGARGLRWPPETVPRETGSCGHLSCKAGRGQPHAPRRDKAGPGGGLHRSGQRGGAAQHPRSRAEPFSCVFPRRGSGARPKTLWLRRCRVPEPPSPSQPPPGAAPCSRPGVPVGTACPRPARSPPPAAGNVPAFPPQGEFKQTSSFLV